MNFLREESLISLDELRKILIRLEDTIIFSLIERCQFGRNHQIYDVNSISIESKSFLDFLLFEMEAVHAKARRTNLHFD